MLKNLQAVPPQAQGEPSLIEIEHSQNGVALIRIKDRENSNGVSTRLLQKLRETLELIRQDRRCRAIVLTGDGDRFLTRDGVDEIDGVGADVQTLILESEIPVIAAVSGDASGWGWLLAMCCDGAVYSDEGVYSYPDMTLGRTPRSGATLLFPHRMGDYLGREILFEGKAYSGEALRTRGKCISVFRSGVENHAMAMAARWAGLSHENLSALKRELSKDLRDRMNGIRSLEDQMRRRVSRSANEHNGHADRVPKSPSTGFSSEVVTLDAFENGIVRVTMCDRSSKNTFSEALAKGLLEVFAHIRQCPDYKVVVLTGYDNYFACGGTKAGLLAIQSGTMKFSDVAVYSLGLDCDIPVIAAMQGHGIGAGWAMGMFCDFAVFGRESTYVSNYMRYGFTPGAGATLIFPHRFGENMAREILFTANEYKGHALEARGIAMPVAARSDVMECAMSMADRIALSSREALVALKTHMCQSLRDRVEDIFAREVAMHEKTFVGNQDVAHRIQKVFNEGHHDNEVLNHADHDGGHADNRDTDLTAIRAVLRSSLAQELYIEERDVDPDRQFIDMGLDSVTGVSWIRKINARFGLSISATKVYDFPTMNLLSGYVLALGKKEGVFAAERRGEVRQPDAPVLKEQAEDAGERDLAEVRTTLKALLAEELYVDVDALDDGTAFVDMGLDSVTGVTWVRKINARYGLSIPATKVYDYTTIDRFARYVVETGQQAGVVFTRAENTMPPSQPAQQVDDTAPTAASSRGGCADNRIESEKDESPRQVVSAAAPHGRQRQRHALSHRGQTGYGEAIAIVGMAGQFPKSKTLDEFWDNLAHGRDCISEVPMARWDMDRYYDPDPQAPGKTYCKHMGVLDDVDKFDPLFFNISPAEAKFIEPQQRLFLENCWACIEDSGIDPYTLSDSRCGVFVGCGVSDYGQGLSAHDLMGGAASILSARIAYLLNLKGPCLAIDTSCSSSLVAIAEACNSLVLGTSDLALAGGVCVLAGPAIHVMTSKAGMLSKDSRCHTFDARANGFVPGEGVGVILLKRLADAVRDQDPIAGVIRGWGVNQDGKTNGITAPSANSQTLLEKEVYKRFDINPETISLVEAHGTGTKLGDPIEVEALTASFQHHTQKKDYCALGSVKSNIGHLMTAAGVAGTIKVLLAMRHKALPPTINFEKLNEHISLENSPFYVNTALQPWDTAAGTPRRAAVSSFGFSGTNAHIVIEEFRAEETFSPAVRSVPDEGRSQLFVLSAKSEDQLKQYAARIRDHVASCDDVDLVDMAYTLQVGRAVMDCRMAVLADSRAALLEKLERYIETGACPSVLTGRAKAVDAIDVLSSDDDARALVRMWLKKRKLDKLARLWVTGLSIDWPLLYENDSPRRCNLPTYPFADERYWNEKTSNPVAGDGVATLYPPVHAHTSTFETPDEDVANGSTVDPVQYALDKLIGLVAKITRIPASRIDAEADFEHLGLDSIMIASLNNELKDWVGRLEATLFYKYKTLSSLADYLVSTYPDAVQAKAAVAIAASPRPAFQPSPSQQHQALRSHGQPGLANPEIAIIGMSGKYPQADNLNAFWRNLCEGRDCVTEIPRTRFDYQPLFSEEKGRADSIYCKWGGFLDDIDRFDALFFNVSPQDARMMDPQERLFLEAVWTCLESAGYITPHWQKNPRNIGVFAGATFNNYQLLAADAAGQRLLSPVNSQTFSIANHVSYFFNLTGPSMTLDTACSASLYAVHLACESIKRGESEMAIAGGVNLSLHPSKYFTICARGFAASDGRCHAFADGGDGYVPSEGVGAVLLKPLSLAREDGDDILAVIKGTGVSHDGKTQNYTAPNPVAQTKAIEAALRQADISPDSMSYIEAHGTGTVLGDPIEIAGLMDAFSKRTARKQFCAIGSVKTNIGHGEAAAGIAQLTKTVLQMRHQTLVPTLLHGRVNPNIDFENSPFYIQREIAPWRQPQRNGDPLPRRAGISSFGAGGVNVHVVLEEYPGGRVAAPDVPTPVGSSFIVPFSAHVQSQLEVMVRDVLAFFADNDGWRMEDIAYTLQTRRASLRFRLAFVANSPSELLEHMRRYLNQGESVQEQRWCYQGDARATGPESEAAIGAGHDHPDMARLMTRGRVDEIAERWTQGADIPWEQWYCDKPGYRCPALPTYPFLRKRYWIAEVAEHTGSPDGVDTGKDDAAADIADVHVTPAIQDAALTAGRAPSRQGGGKPAAATLTPVLEEIIDLSDLDREERLSAHLAEQIKDILGFDAGETIDRELGFFELGMESMQSMNLHQRLQAQLAVTLSDTVLFDFPTIKRLTEHLLSVIAWDELIAAEKTPVAAYPPVQEANPSRGAQALPDLPDTGYGDVLSCTLEPEIEGLSEAAVIEELLSELDA